MVQNESRLSTTRGIWVFLGCLATVVALVFAMGGRKGPDQGGLDYTHAPSPPSPSESPYDHLHIVNRIAKTERTGIAKALNAAEAKSEVDAQKVYGAHKETIMKETELQGKLADKYSRGVIEKYKLTEEEIGSIRTEYAYDRDPTLHPPK